MADTPSEKQLLAGCLSGDPSGQEAFIRHYSRLVFSAIQRVVQTKSATLSRLDIEDLHSSVFVNLLERRCRKLRQYKGKNGCSVASWVRMITVRTVLDHLRRRKDALAVPQRMVSLDDLDDLVSNAPSPVVHLTAREQMQIIETGLQALSHRDQLMIRMHFFEGRTLSQVARVLNLSASNVHSVKHRALKRLKDVIAGQARDG